MSTFKEILDLWFDGVITKGAHPTRSDRVCALELLAVKNEIHFTDEPIEVKCFDIRPINDMNVPDELRTEYMLKMLEAYEGSLDWDKVKQKKVVEKIVISTVNQLIADLPGLRKDIVERCKTAKTLEEARIAAEAASRITYLAYVRVSRTRVGNARDASSAAAAAAYHVGVSNFSRATYAATKAAGSAARAGGVVTDIFTTACNIWLEAAKD